LHLRLGNELSWGRFGSYLRSGLFLENFRLVFGRLCQWRLISRQCCFSHYHGN
jgi:hypothetical protein